MHDSPTAGTVTSSTGTSGPVTSGPGAAGDDDEVTAELTDAYWQAYRERMATTGFLAIARRFPALVGQALRLGFEASRTDLITTVTLNLIAGVLTGFALFATTGVLEALFAEGPTPERVRAALPSLIFVAAATAARAGLSAAAGWAQSRLQPQVEQAVELRLYDLTTQVELSAFDDASHRCSGPMRAGCTRPRRWSPT